MVAEIDNHVICITRSWANTDMVDAELALSSYVMFRKDRRERRGGGVILYITKCIQAYEITLKREADCEEAIWCNINNSLSCCKHKTRCKITKGDKGGEQGECVIMGDFNHGHI